MKEKYLLVGFLALLLGACATSAPEFSWYHPMGGEHLFAYDAGECELEVASGGRSLGTETDGPFFQCMHQRGYYLVDDSGVLRGPVVAVRSEPQSITLQ